MTGPALNTFQDLTSDTQQQKELEQYLRMRKQMMVGLNDDLNSFKMTGAVPGLATTVPGTDQIQAPPPKPAASPEVAGLVTPELENAGTSELVFRARELGIASPEDMPTNILRQAIAQRRADMRPKEDVGAGMGLLASVAEAGLGAAGTTVDLARQISKPIPWVGDFLDRTLGENNVKGWLNALDEGVRANISENDQHAANIYSGAGTFLAYAGVGEAAFKGLGAVVDLGAGVPLLGRIAGSAMARGAIQGLGTAVLLDTGSDRPWLPSMDDAAKLFAGDSSLLDRGQSALNLTFGNRLVNGALSAAMGGFGERLAEQMKMKAYTRKIDAGYATLEAQKAQLAWAAANQQGPLPFAMDNAGRIIPKPEPIQGPNLPQGFSYDPSQQGFDFGNGGPPNGGGPVGGGPGGGAPDLTQGLRSLAPEEAAGAQVSLDGQPLPSGSRSVVRTPTSQDPEVQAFFANQRAAEGPIGPERQLTGPMGGHPSITVKDYSNNVQEHLQAAERFRSDLSQVDDPASMAMIQHTIDYHTQAAADYERGVDRIVRDRANYLTTTVPEVAPQLLDLRGNMNSLQEQIEAAANAGRATDDLAAQLSAHEDQFDSLIRSAGISPYRLPNIWDVVRDNPLSPKTLTASIAEQHGTAFVTPDGSPKVMFHGTGFAFGDVDRAALDANPNGNLVGPGMYFTENPIIAGGDPHGITDEAGYAGGRAAQADGEWAMLQDQKLTAEQTVKNFEEQGPGSGIDPEAYQHYKELMPQIDEAIANFKHPAPNVRPAFLATKNLFEYDKPMAMEQGLQYIKAASEHPEGTDIDWNDVAKKWMDHFDPESDVVKNLSHYEINYNGPNGHHLYDTLWQAEIPPVEVLVGDGWSSVDPGLTTYFGKSAVRDVMQDMGHDGIRYEGGTRLGAGSQFGKHDAVVVFDPRHILPVYADEPMAQEAASALGMKMNKLETTLGSPAAAELANHSVIGDADVVKAMISADPGSHHVLKGVEDMKSLLEGLMEDKFKGADDPVAAMMKSYRPVMHPSGRLDVLVSSFGEVTDKMAEDYSKTGLFEGMDVVTNTGKGKKVVRVLDNGMVVVQSEAQAKKGPTFSNTIKLENISGSNNAKQVIDAPDLYKEFKNYALNETTMRVQSLGHDNYIANWFDDPQVYQRLTPLSDTFFNERGIGDPATRSALYRFFNNERIAEFGGLAPEEVNLAHSIAEEVDAAEFENSFGHEAPDLHAEASVKGYTLVPNEGKPGYVLHDNLGPSQLPMETEEAVQAFLAEASHERLPDAAPAVPVPVEVVPTYSDSELHVQPTHAVRTQQLIEDVLANEQPDLWSFDPQTQADGGSGTGGPPSVPPGSNVGQPGASGGALPPKPSKDFLRQQLKNQAVIEVMHRHDRGLVGKMIQPMRSFFQNLEGDLHAAGATDIRPWQSFDDIISGWDAGHNYTHEFQESVSKSLQAVRTRNLNKWWRVFEIQNPTDRALYGVAQGLNKAEVLAMGDVERSLIKMHGGDDGAASVSELRRFVAETRTRQSMGDYGPKSYDADKYSSIGFYADHAKDTRVRFENVDPRQVLQQYIRSYGFNKYAGAAWNDAQQTWTAIRDLKVEGITPYRQLGNFMLDWMDYAQRGAQPGKDLAVRVVRGTLSKLGVPLTHTETRKLMQSMMTSMYEATQGWRVHVIARDSLQPLLAAPTVDMMNLAKAYKTAASWGSDARKAMLNRAYEMGVTQKAMPRVEGTGYFEHTGIDEATQFNPIQKGIRAIGQAVGGVVRDVTPSGLRNLDLSVVGPLGLYTREGEWNRIIVGEAAHTKFTEALDAFKVRQKVASLVGDPSLIPNMDDLMRDTNSDSFAPPVVRKIKDLLAAGNDKEATATYMRSVADRTQFTYGGRHAPRAVRTTAARMGYAFGNFSTQSIQLGKEFLKYGSATHKVKALATIAGVTGALELAHRQTGWNFRNYEWWQSLGFTGSPLLRGAVDAYQQTSNASNVLFQDNPDPNAEKELSQLRGTDLAGQLMRTFNPFQGAIYTAGGVSRAMDSPNPDAGLAQLFMTGNTRGGASQYNEMLSAGNPTAPQLTAPLQHAVQLHNPIVHSPLQHAPSPGQVERTIAPPGRLPGANQFNGQQQVYEQMMQRQMQRMGATPLAPGQTAMPSTDYYGKPGGGAF